MRVDSDLDRYCLIGSGGILFLLGLTNTYWQNDAFSAFNAETMIATNLKLSKKLKECTVSFLSAAERMVVPPFGNKKRRKVLS